VSEQIDPTGKSLGIAIGHLALRRGFITPEQLRDALIEQSKSAQLPLESVLMTRGLLTRMQVELLHTLRETTVFPTEPTPAQDSAPSQLGKYAIAREVGQGAMAKVYEALDTDLQRKVALKILNASPNAHPEEAAVEEERFLREARMLASVPKHPNIVGIYDAGITGGRRYLAMEFVDGIPMDQWCKKGSVTLGRPTSLLRDVALAVHQAHQNGVVHRDLKPANILVDSEGRPHVMDFGLAKLVGQNIRASYTEGSLAVGTPAYMSPEQASGAKTVDRRTDVYSMGVMLYEILTGKLPFVGASPMEVMIKTSKDPVVPPSKITGIQINPETFKTLESVCLKALSKNPADRHATAERFAEDLTNWLRGRRFRVGRSRHRVLWTAGTVAALLLLGFYFLKPGSVPAQPAAMLPAPAVQPAPPSAPPPPDPWKTAIGLLKRIDLPVDAVSGKWEWDGDVLLSREGKPARIQIPYHPPDEYDLRITFSRRPANFCVNLILTHDAMPFTLVMQREGYFGFERIAGKDFNRNPSAARFDTPLQIGRSYTVLVEVRNAGVKTYCEGQALSRMDTYEDLAMNPDWKIPDPLALGVGTWDGGAAIERIEIREVGGKGEFQRPEPPKK